MRVLSGTSLAVETLRGRLFRLVVLHAGGYYEARSLVVHMFSGCVLMKGLRGVCDLTASANSRFIYFNRSYRLAVLTEA